MGYRSQVVLALDAKIVPAFMAMFAKNEEAQKLCTVHMDTLDTDYQGEGNWLIVWDGIKWYNSYPDVGAIIKFIEALNLDDLSEYGMKNLEDSDGDGCGGYFKFCRVGEDHDDIESDGWAFDDIAVQRDISF